MDHFKNIIDSYKNLLEIKYEIGNETFRSIFTLFMNNDLIQKKYTYTKILIPTLIKITYNKKYVELYMNIINIYSL